MGRTTLLTPEVKKRIVAEASKGPYELSNELNIGWRTIVNFMLSQGLVQRKNHRRVSGLLKDKVEDGMFNVHERENWLV